MVANSAPPVNGEHQAKRYQARYPSPAQRAEPARVHDVQPRYQGTHWHARDGIGQLKASPEAGERGKTTKILGQRDSMISRRRTGSIKIQKYIFAYYNR